MRDVFDIYTIIFLALAVFIFLRLRSVLGQRTGRERPPYDPYSAREPVRPAPEKVVALPNRAPEAAAAKPVDEPVGAGRALEGRRRGRLAAGRGLDAIVAADAEFRRASISSPARAPPTR